MKKCKIVCVIILLINFSNYSFGQKNELILSESEKDKTVKAINKVINENYIFPEVSDKIIQLLNANQKSGKYEPIDDYKKFANVLTKDIQSFNHDRHLRVLYEPKRIAEQELVVSIEDSIKFEQDYISDLKQSNYHFKQIKILEGNIGYLDFRRFREPEYAAETVISAMGFLSNTDAIIIDLRNNGGGSPKMVQFLSSYFFGDEAVHLNSIYKRRNKQNNQYWTLPYVQGKKIPNVHLYILTSGRTFSAAEEFSYNLKHLKRAILVGETTGGGAHPGGRKKATDKYNVWTPIGRAINPITGTNWEGVGVIPHIKTSAQDALLTAHLKALDSLKSVNKDVIKNRFYDWHLESLKAKKNPLHIDSSILKNYTGNFGIRTISFKNGNIFYQRKDSIKYALIPIRKDIFIIEELSDFRIQFLFENNKVVAIKGLKEDGTSSKYKIN